MIESSAGVDSSVKVIPADSTVTGLFGNFMAVEIPPDMAALLPEVQGAGADTVKRSGS